MRAQRPWFSKRPPFCISDADGNNFSRHSLAAGGGDGHVSPATVMRQEDKAIVFNKIRRLRQRVFVESIYGVFMDTHFSSLLDFSLSNSRELGVHDSWVSMIFYDLVDSWQLWTPIFPRSQIFGLRMDGSWMSTIHDSFRKWVSTILHDSAAYLSSKRSQDRGAHFCGIPVLLSSGDAAAAIEGPGSGFNRAIDPGEVCLDSTG